MQSVAHMDFTTDLTILAEPQRVFNALTRGVGAWWGRPYLEEEAVGLELELKVGGRFWERWSHDPHSNEGALLGTVVAIRHPRLLRIQGSFGMGERLIDGLVTFEVSLHETGAFLHFNHKAIGDFDERIKTDYGRGWHDLLGRLKFYLEEGEGEGISHSPSMHHHS